MRWFSRRADPPTRGRHAAGAHPVVTPTAPAPALRDKPQPEPEVHTPPAASPSVPSAVLPAAPLAGSGVHLGFGDGSALELGVADSRAATFRALAASLTQGVR